MKKGYAVSLAVVGVAACVAVFAVNSMGPKQTALYNAFTAEDAEFMKFVSKYGKSYGTKEEFEFRSQQFKQNFAKVHMNNARNDVTYRLGINKFADYTPSEYKRLLGYKKLTTNKNIQFLDVPNADTVNWVTAGKVNPVKDQGQCGSCWAFSAIGSIESHYAIEHGKLLSLSEQELVDCSYSPDGNQGCNGGDMDLAFQFAETSALESESDYPYEASDDKCRYDASKGLVKVQSFVDVAQNNQEQLKAAIAKGPVSVAIEADTFVFQFYSGGILNDEGCGTNLDHGVVAVGYGVENGQEYFLVRNSWGASWGDNGYIKIANDGKANSPGICGIASQPTYPITAQ